MIVDETRQELAERMAQELDVSVSRALVAVDNLIERGLIELAVPWAPLYTAPQDSSTDILIKMTYSDGFSFQDVAKWVDAASVDERGMFRGGKGNYRPQDPFGKNREGVYWRPLRRDS